MFVHLRWPLGGIVSRLELKIPPDVVGLMTVALMLLASVTTPRLVLPPVVRVPLALLLVIGGVWLIVAARLSLERAHTSWRPMTPSQTTSLVTSGVYRMSRNPIYLGMLLVLLGAAVALASPVSLILSAGFVLYIDRFQIRPEERVLRAKLGPEYSDYVARVRRWV